MRICRSINANSSSLQEHYIQVEAIKKNDADELADSWILFGPRFYLEVLFHDSNFQSFLKFITLNRLGKKISFSPTMISSMNLPIAPSSQSAVVKLQIMCDFPFLN